jgi:hypothetical protein
MNKHTLAFYLRRVLLALTLACCGHASAAVLHVQIDTRNFGVASGYLDMMLSASAGVPLATATVTNLRGFGSATVADQFGVTSIAGGYLFRNDTANDLFQSVDFGGLLSFDLTIEGDPDPLNSYISRFVVSAFDAAIAPLGTYDPVTGALAEFTWTPSPNADSPGTLGSIVSDARSVTLGLPVPQAEVPEPATPLLMVLALGLATLLRRMSAAPQGCSM